MAMNHIFSLVVSSAVNEIMVSRAVNEINNNVCTIMFMLHLLNHCKLAKLDTMSLILNIINHIHGGGGGGGGGECSWPKMFFVVTMKKKVFGQNILE